jgi:hypothetical protein
LLVAGVTAVACIIAVACTAAVSGIPAVDGAPLFSDVLTVAGLPAIAGITGFVVSVIAFVHAFAGNLAVAVIFAVARQIQEPIRLSDIVAIIS